MQESIKDEVAGNVKIHWRKFCLRGWIFSGGDCVLEKGSEELLWVSHVIPLACVMHEGKVGPTPVIIDIWEEEGFLMQSNE